ncbi:MAG: hypothetical protein A2W09_00620 [Deltaproteobacteria bacterium RBG_16_50_11]|nr:MAG: hypothetical protein A2W09_00620 [Deltaproteobacteria bacterium RBG_16_50_11]
MVACNRASPGPPDLMVNQFESVYFGGMNLRNTCLGLDIGVPEFRLPFCLISDSRLIELAPDPGLPCPLRDTQRPVNPEEKKLVFVAR